MTPNDTPPADAPPRGRRLARVLGFPLLVVAALALALPTMGADAADPNYPSSDCTDPAGEVLDGFIGPVRFLLRTHNPSADVTWVCVALDNGSVHVGGKVVIDAGLPSAPGQDVNHAACAADPANTHLRSGTIGPNNEPYRFDLTNRADAIWLCVRATSAVGLRLIVPKDGPAAPTFLPDSTAPQPTTTTTTTAPPPTTTTAPTYFSNDCGPASTAVVDGFVDGSYVKVRTEQVSSPTPATWVCVAVDNGTTHRGGRLVLGGAATPTVDDSQAACDASPATQLQHLQQGGLHLDVNQSPTAVWVCIGAPSVAKRVVVPVAGLGGVNFLSDPNAPFGYVEKPAPAGQASSACQNATGGTKTRVVNADVGSGHVWAYTWQESGSRTHVCLRAQTASGSGGGRLTLDGNGTQTFASTDTSSDFAPCPVNIVSDTADPAYSVKISNPGSPAWACVQVTSTYRRVKLDAGGSQSIVGFSADT